MSVFEANERKLLRGNIGNRTLKAILEDVNNILVREVRGCLIKRRNKYYC